MYLYMLLASIVVIAIIVFIIDAQLCKTWEPKTRWAKRRIINYPGIAGALIASLIFVVAIYSFGSAGMMSDVEILNGKVISKTSDKVSCRHSYSCHCHTVYSGSGKNRTSSTECDTCYEHSFDMDWDVNTTLGTYSINTIDRQGLAMPPRWSQVKIDEPVAKEHTYTNYIKASPQSLFNSAANVAMQFQGQLPAHPGGISDYYHTVRLVLTGIPQAQIDSTAWNTGIAEILKDIGSSKQVNLVVVITNNQSSLFANALKTEWIGGKKNEAVIVIGAPHYPEIAWVDVFSWSQNDLFNVTLRDDVKNLKTVDRDQILRISYVDIVKLYQRKSMKDYKYLEDELEPDMWIFVLAIVLGVIPFGVYLMRSKFGGV